MCDSVFVSTMTWTARRSTLFPYTTLFRSPKPAGPGLPRAPPSMYATMPSELKARVGVRPSARSRGSARSEEHTSELQSHVNLVCRLLLEKKNNEGKIERSLQRQPEHIRKS